MNSTVKPHYRVTAGRQALPPQILSGGCALYQFGSRNNPGSMEIFAVFPGIELIYSDFSMEHCDCGLAVDGNLLEITYCLEGREECQLLCGDYLYLGKGDLYIARMENNLSELCFPTGRYRGITILLDLDILLECPPPLLEPEIVRSEQFGERFCPGQRFFAVRPDRQISHIFEELCENYQAFRPDYYKIKVLELLLCLSMIDPEHERRLEPVSKNQIKVVKQAQRRLTRNFQERVTIEQLAKEFCISPTSLKRNFKLVYNTTIKNYVRRERMALAASLLNESGQTIAEIARSLGYANQSKFASAFQSVYGLTPLKYRRKCANEHRNSQVPGQVL